MPFRKINRGFTLIELLVVIAIIAVLASVILVFVGQSKDSGGNAGVKSNLLNARPQAEVYFANQVSYQDVCLQASTQGVWKQVQAAVRAGGRVPKATPYSDSTASTATTEECHDDVAGYVVWVPLKESTSASPRAWCIDAANASKVVTTVLSAGSLTCPVS